MTKRPRPLAFESRGAVSLTDDRYKLIRNAKSANYELYDIPADPNEQTDLAAKHPDIVNRMRKTLDNWRASCAASGKGGDY
jgi:arylsulfatase A-like enzyme